VVSQLAELEIERARFSETINNAPALRSEPYTQTTNINSLDQIADMGDATPSQSQSVLYFGYGSNLWIQQMHSRCPNSHYLGIARLKGYKWIINSRGYANIVELPKESSLRTRSEAWGLVFYLTPSDEARLDKNEGVPVAYTKENLRVDFWRHKLEEGKVRINIGDEKPVPEETLVYIDRGRVQEAKPKEEYVVRMNKGIEDALAFGVPEAYVEEVMRKFIPAVKDGKVDEQIARKAEEQALRFVDENEVEE
jgi:hypothetical protein